MRKKIFIVALLFSFVSSIGAFEGVRLPIVVGIQSQGCSPYEGLIADMAVSLSDVVNDQSFIFRDLSIEDLSDPSKTGELDYLFSSATVFAALQHYAGFSAVASVMPTSASGPNHANALTLVVRNIDKSIRTMKDVESCEIGLPNGASPDVSVLLNEEFVIRGLKPERPIVIRHLLADNTKTLLQNFAQRRDPVCALALDTALGLDEKTLTSYGLKILEPRLSDELKVGHTSATYPGWVLSANFKVDRDAAMRLGALLRTMVPHSDWQWSTPADFRSMHAFLQRSDPFYSAFEPKSIVDYLKEYQSVVLGIICVFLGIVMHVLRTGHLLRRRTRELLLANEERLHNEQRFHILEKQNIVGQLSSIVAHEIRQPLAAASNYAMALRRRYKNNDLSDSTLEYGLDRLVAETDRANEIIDYVQKYVAAAEKDKKWLDIPKLLNDIPTLSVKLS